MEKVYKTDNFFGRYKNRLYKTKKTLFFSLIVITLLILFYSSRFIELFYFIYEGIGHINSEVISLITWVLIVISFYFTDKYFNLGFKKRHYFFIIFMSFAGLFLYFLYFKYSLKDKLEHLFFSMMVGSIIYHLIRKLGLKKWKSLLFTFSITFSILTIHEIIEYSLDIFFNWRAQGVFIKNPLVNEGFELVQSRIDDTMIDLFFDIIGTTIYTIFLYFYLKWKEKHIQKIIPDL